MTPDEKSAWVKEQGSSYDYVPVIEAAKRLGVKWSPWMGDWFVSWSPRNDNDHAEGTWDHWVDLALKILSDPLTKIVRPEAHIEKPDTFDFYDESNRYLTDAELFDRLNEQDEK